MSKDQLSKGADEGTMFGQAPADKVSLYGVTPVVQAANVTAATTLATNETNISTVGPALSLVVTKLNSVLTALKGLGILATA